MQGWKGVNRAFKEDSSKKKQKKKQASQVIVSDLQLGVKKKKKKKKKKKFGWKTLQLELKLCFYQEWGSENDWKIKAFFSAVENDPLEKWINNMKINYWNKNILQNTLQKNWCLRSHQRELCSTCGISVFFTCWYYFLRCFREQCRLHLWQNALQMFYPYRHQWNIFNVSCLPTAGWQGQKWSNHKATPSYPQ